MATSPKKNFAVYSNENLMARMAALKVGILNQETESRNGIRNQISIIEKYDINIP